MISSIEYNNAKDGKATTTKIKEGSTVHIISNTVPCTTFLPVSALDDVAPKNTSVRTKTIKTKNKIKVIKNIRSWCKLMIPSITGVAAS